MEKRMVRRLWLLRHAKSSWDEPGLADHDRPLAPRGRKAARRIGGWAEDNGVRPELVLCSTALRTRATLDLVSGALGAPTAQIEEVLYHASAEALLERLLAVPADIGDLLVIGHNPGLHGLACMLAPPGPDSFPTGALAEIRLSVESWRDLRPGCGSLAQLVLPRSLPG
jgi:phosphohistidine phosphatase